MNPTRDRKEMIGDGMNPIAAGKKAIADGIHPITAGKKATEHGINPITAGIKAIGDGINPITAGKKVIAGRIHAIADRKKGSTIGNVRQARDHPNFWVKRKCRRGCARDRGEDFDADIAASALWLPPSGAPCRSETGTEAGFSSLLCRMTSTTVGEGTALSADWDTPVEDQCKPLPELAESSYPDSCCFRSRRVHLQASANLARRTNGCGGW